MHDVFLLLEQLFEFLKPIRAPLDGKDMTTVKQTVEDGGGQHLDELAAPRQERVEHPESLVGKRPDGRAHSLGKQGQDGWYTFGVANRYTFNCRLTTGSSLATSMPTNGEEVFIVRPPVRRVSRPCPALQDAGWLPGQLFGLVNEERMAPQLTHGLEDHRRIELPSAVIRLHGA